MSKLDFCCRYVHLDGRPISFADRPYLPAIYGSRARTIVLRCSRQCEKSTYLVNTLLYEAVRRAGIKILVVLPRAEQARVFAQTRLLRCVEESPLLRRHLKRRLRHLNVGNIAFANGSQVFMRSAYRDADSARGLSADLLLVDEYQDIAPGALAVLREALSHSPDGRVILTGTPKSIENPLEDAYRRTEQFAWTTRCSGCGRDVVLDERALGPCGPICGVCRAAIDPRQGAWVAQNPGGGGGDGFWCNHMMVPWGDYSDVLERQQTYDAARFRNECLGLPSSLGDHVVTPEELERCCDPRPMARRLQDVPAELRAQLVAAIDWGGGAISQTVMVLGALDAHFRFQILAFERFRAEEDSERIVRELAERCRRFQVRFVAADGAGNGHTYNRFLLSRMAEIGWGASLYAIFYGEAGGEPVQDGVIWKWRVGRSPSIGALFTRVKMGTLRFPQLRDCSSFLQQFACVYAEYDDDQRSIRYRHPETAPDDALHAANYGLALALRRHQGGQY